MKKNQYVGTIFLGLMLACAEGLAVSSEETLPLVTSKNTRTESEGFPIAPLRLCVLVEPSPFTYVCGYSNRYQELFRSLNKANQQQQQQHVEVVTVEVVAKDPPTQAFGFPIHYTKGVRLPFYKRMSLSIDWTLQVFRMVRRFRPNLIHVSSP
jgi:sulfoquinovosyltransferase